MTAELSIAWIGTGVMGGPMAGHLLDAGHRLSVFNRTRSRADDLLARGASWRDSPAQVALEADVVCTMLGTPADVREVVRGDLEPGFKVEHFIKDLGIALAEARRMGVSLPGAALAEQLYLAVRSQGLGQKGTQSLAVALARLSHLQWPSP